MTEAPALPNRIIAGAVGAALGALLLLACVGFAFVSLDHFYLRGLNRILSDQAGYVCVARHYVDSGHLQSSTIYPSTLAQQTTKSYFYLPGHYLVLAAAFRILGYSVTSAFVPGLMAFLITASLVFVLASQFYGVRVACLALFLFSLFPFNLVLAFSAMSEMTLTVALMIALTVFATLPERLKAIAAPILVFVPLLCRETGAVVFVVVSFALFPSKRWRAAAATTLMSLAVVFIVMRSGIATGRPSLFWNNLISEDFRTIYTDAYAVEGIDRSPQTMLRLASHKLTANAALLAHPSASQYRPDGAERMAFFLLLSVIPIGAIRSRMRKDRFAAGVAAAMLALLLLLLAFYSIWGYRGLRNVLLVQPLASMVFAAAVMDLSQRFRIRAVVVSLIVLAQALYAYEVLKTTYQPQPFLDVAGERDVRFLASIGHDDKKVLVAPHWMSSEYVVEHYPVRWSFIPANLGTLRLLEQKYPIGTIVYPLLSDMDRARIGILSPGELQQDGWRAVEIREAAGVRLAILRR